MHPPEFLAEPKRVAKGTLVGEKLFGQIRTQELRKSHDSRKGVLKPSCG
jgi:hypothetical protein